MSAGQEDRLLQLIGPDALLALVEAYGGDRLYVAKEELSKLSAVVGPIAARKLASVFGGEAPAIPLARTFRAAQYRAAGLSNPEIARRLGVTVRAVERLFVRVPVKRPPRARRQDPRQLNIFE